MRRAASQAQIRIKGIRTNEQIEALRTGEIDMGICHSPISSTSWMEDLTFAEYRIQAVLPAAQADTDPAGISMAELATKDLVLFPENKRPADTRPDS